MDTGRCEENRCAHSPAHELLLPNPKRPFWIFPGTGTLSNPSSKGPHEHDLNIDARVRVTAIENESVVPLRTLAAWTAAFHRRRAAAALARSAERARPRARRLFAHEALQRTTSHEYSWLQKAEGAEVAELLLGLIPSFGSVTPALFRLCVLSALDAAALIQPDGNHISYSIITY